MDDLEKTARRNRLLNALPKAELQQLLPAMERISLFSRQVLYRPGGPIDFVYFPLDALLSMVASAQRCVRIKAPR